MSRHRRHYKGDIRERVYERDGNRCLLCLTAENLTLDHVTGRAEGGKSTMDNLRTLCARCNESLGRRHGDGAFRTGWEQVDHGRYNDVVRWGLAVDKASTRRWRIFINVPGVKRSSVRLSAAEARVLASALLDLADQLDSHALHFPETADEPVGTPRTPDVVAGDEILQPSGS